MGGNYSTDYAQREVVARLGLGANLVQDAVYVENDASVSLHGGRDYTITLRAGQLPPAKGFWSLSVYGPDGYFLPHTTRPSLGDRSNLATDEHGSTTIHLQHKRPLSPGQYKNWLPTPAESNFSLLWRIYWPENSVLNGSWYLPAVAEHPKSSGQVLLV